jgi:ElaB/YqjD/DUF883 family membrane-anchored ribosome-binding protein
MEERAGGGRNNGDMGRDLGAQAQQQLEELRGRIGDLQENVADFIRERPGTSLLIAVGAGFLIGRMLRS